MPFSTAWTGYAVLFGVLFLANSLGEQLDLERRRGKKRWDMILLLIGLTGVLAVGGYLVGLTIPPLIGHSENHLLFPGFGLVGLLAGLLSKKG